MIGWLIGIHLGKILSYFLSLFSFSLSSIHSDPFLSCRVPPVWVERRKILQSGSVTGCIGKELKL
ncbi:hypothetical protein A946_00805 [Methylacidiphilum kamchatkense Kam1]|uniref:Secreted protein n=1 Tax=Methylacidiphilum kamchatkense Kam1 TaxID=1202785 RepID=A0ABR4ZYI8_9BACT|nr:hypothetical protein A946_00805 [Methylacidiphilum kamchatkense Kam1]